MSRTAKAIWILLALSLIAATAFAEQAPHVKQPDLKVACWRIYFSKGSVSCRQATWDKAPNDDIQVTIIWYEQTYRTFSGGKWRTEHYRHLCDAVDYYWLDGCGSADEAAAYKGPRSVKTGRWTSDRNFQRIYNRAYKDVRLPK